MGRQCRGRGGRGRGGRGRGGRGKRRGDGSGGRGANGSTTLSLSSPGEQEEWSNTLTDIVVGPFERDTGPTIPVSPDPTDMFLRFFTPDLILHITAETNRYAAACLARSNPTGGPVQSWSTDEEEIISAYLGFSILMGITKVPDLYDYWSTDDTMHNFAIVSRIPHKRFLEIQRYLHFVDNSTLTYRGQEGYDSLSKVRPVLSSIQKSFLTNYHPHEQNSIDEAMEPFTRQSCQKQYVPLKIVQRGFKLWV